MNIYKTYNETNINNFKTHKYPWFIKKYHSKAIVTIKDLELLLNININSKVLNNKNIIFRKDWNALGQGYLRKEFEKDNNIYYEEETFFFVYLSGFFKILKLLLNESKISLSQIESILIHFT